MKFIDEVITVDTGSKVELIDITESITSIIAKSGIKTGSITLFSVHTTTALIINENEKGLVKDIEDAIISFIGRDLGYRHNAIDNNAPSHIAGAFLGNDLSLIVKGGSLVLGRGYFWSNSTGQGEER
ncbi:MAG: secondary thiamine-phosphate synthase enzyme YjbQ [Actinomycetota bacterium]|nr:secondary thiamine-phosphate synthase enzyme YjbQ [Actinomycetota bacterium]